MSENTSIQSRLLAEKQKQAKQGSMKPFNATVIDVGIEPVKHFPNVKDETGKTVRDENGRAKKQKNSDGWSHTFAVFGQRQFVTVVLPKKLNLVPATPYKISGFGYDMGTFFYIEQEGQVRNY